MGVTDWRIVEDDLTGSEIRALLHLHMEHMLASSPEGSTHFLDIDGLRQPDVTFWSIWDGVELAGCGALREIDAGHGELKSMRTSPEHLGRRVGRTLLTHIVDQARHRGYGRISLETGSSAAFDAAQHLYASFGFEACGPFADYVEDPFSRFFTMEL